MNSALLAIAHFFLSVWLWSITWGFYHLPLSIFLLMILIKKSMGLRMVPTVLISLFSPLSSFCALSLVTVVFVVHGLGLEYQSASTTLPLPAVCLALGCAYTILHVLFCFILNRFYSINVRHLATLGGIAHLIASWFVYLFASLRYL